MKSLLIAVSMLTMVSCMSDISGSYQMLQFAGELTGELLEDMSDDECMTDACISERTGDVNPADPTELDMEDSDPSLYTEDERNE